MTNVRGLLQMTVLHYCTIVCSRRQQQMPSTVANYYATASDTASGLHTLRTTSAQTWSISIQQHQECRDLTIQRNFILTRNGISLLTSALDDW